MDPVNTISATTPVVPLQKPATPEDENRDASSERQVLEPAVSVELSRDASEATSDAIRRGYERDSATQALVYRITDASSGELVVQIPDEVVLKARAYARETAQPAGERIEKQA